MSTAEKISALLEKFGEKRGKIDLSLGRIKAFLELIGSPQLRLPPVIHFAGTNGKGSTIAFLKAIIEASGQSCHVYTSPHLVRFNERIVLNGKPVEDDILYKILLELEENYNKHKHEIELTFFELATVAGFMAFSEFPADYLLLETGMGGRYDATNILDKPKLTVITPISYDHTEFLGETIAEITFEKAGIIKENVPCICSLQEDIVKKLLQTTANEKHTKILFAENTTNLPPLSLKGEHQKINAATATLAAQTLGFSNAAITTGLASAIWPARMQKLVSGKLIELLPSGYDLWLDGAHNIAGAEILAAEISHITPPVYIILGMLNNKDAAGYFKIIKDKVAAIYTIPIPDEANSFTAEQLKSIAKENGIDAIAAPDAAAAIKDIVIRSGQASSIFICGSLYLAGHILKDNA